MSLTSAPPVRTVNQLPALPESHWPSQFWDANAAADRRIEEFDRLRNENARLRTAVELQRLRQRCVEAIDSEIERMAAALDMVRAENVSLRCRIDELTDCGGLEHQIREQGSQLIAANSLVTRLRGERDLWRERALAAGWES